MIKSQNVWYREIPNLITLGNLSCGLLGISFVMGGQEVMGFLCMLLGSFLDFFDGLVARKLGVTGEMGKQLDSLADVVTFGVLPGLMWKSMMEFQGYCPSEGFCINGYIWLLIPLAAAYRLAKFNIDIRQSNGFYGIPTPITGIALGSFAWLSYNLGHPGHLFFIDNPLIDIRWVFNQFYVWLMMPLVAAYMMLSDLPMLAMKFKAGDPTTKYKWILLGLIVPSAMFGSAGMALFYFLYIIVSLLSNFVIKSK